MSAYREPPTPMGVGGVQHFAGDVQPNIATASGAYNHTMGQLAPRANAAGTDRDIELQAAVPPPNRFNLSANDVITNAATSGGNRFGGASTGDRGAVDALWSQLKELEMTATTSPYGEVSGNGWATTSQVSSQNARREGVGARTPISMFMESGATSRVTTPNTRQMIANNAQAPGSDIASEGYSDDGHSSSPSFGDSLTNFTKQLGVTPFVKSASSGSDSNRHSRTVSFGDTPGSELGPGAGMSLQQKQNAAVEKHSALGQQAKAEAEANAKAKAEAEAAAAAEAEAAAKAEAEAAAKAKATAEAEERKKELAVKAKREAEANALAKQLAEEQAAAAAAQKLIDDAEAAEIAKAREAAQKMEAEKRKAEEERQFKAAEARREKERLAKIALEEALENKRLKEEEEARRVAEEARLEEERRAELEAAKEAELAYDRKLKEKMEQKKAAESEARENALLAREEKKRVDAENSRIAKEERAQKKAAKLQALTEKKAMAAEAEERAHQERLSGMSSTEKKLYLEQVEQQRKEAEFAFRSTYFASGDADGDGMLSLEEALQQGMDEATFRAIDNDGNGQLTMDEFADWQVRNRPKGDFMG